MHFHIPTKGFVLVRRRFEKGPGMSGRLARRHLYLDSQSRKVTYQLFSAHFRNLPAQQFTDPGLRLIQDLFQLSGFDFSLCDKPHNFRMEARLELNGSGLFRREPEIIDHVSLGNMVGFVFPCFGFHFSSASRVKTRFNLDLATARSFLLVFADFFSKQVSTS
jgi:hypothetical protein